nr:HD domain-containing protein [Paenibacillus sp. yr247]
MEIINVAIEVATYAHRHQYRKGTDIPYISHPFAVGMILAQAECDVEVVAAGILHDVVEDTEITLLEIEQRFGRRVAQIVSGVSEPDKSLTWEERKKHTLEFLKTAPLEIRLVSCADKLHNIVSIRRDMEKIGEAVWSRFNRGKEQQAWYYRNVLVSLGHSGRFKLLDILQQEIDTVFRTK